MNTPTVAPLRINLQATRATPVSGAPVHVETEIHIVRSMRAADVTPALTQWFNDPTMLAGLNLAAFNFTVDTLQALVASFDNQRTYLLGIFNKADGVIQGFYNFSCNPIHRVANLTLGMGPGKAIGGTVLWDTIDVVFNEMFNHRHIDKITGCVLETNRRLLFTLLHNEHFVHEATLRKECLGRDGRRLDLLMFACFKDTVLRPQGRTRLA